MSRHLWTENEGIDEIKYKLVCTNYELRKYEETTRRLFQLLNTVCSERDEARHQIQELLRKSQASYDTSKKPSMTISTEKCSSGMSSKSFAWPSYDLCLATCQSRDRTETNSPMVDTDHRASIIVDKMVKGKPLPQKGRLLRTVTEAGPLLHTLLLDPLPQWKNPPPFEDRARANKYDPDGRAVIPTSLTLAFPGNSLGPFPISSSACVHVDSDTMQNNILTAKKRKFL